MPTDENHPYTMTVSLSVLKHLGFGLYSNVPAVLSEAVANAWDADATQVTIDIDPAGERIVIHDDGHGMTEDDANDRYLYIGYERRETPGPEGARTPTFKRPVMGRKGIGKLSLFSIAKTVEVQSVRNGERHGFIMDADDIEQVIKDKGNVDYHPKPLPAETVQVKTGTQITLTRTKRRLHRSSTALRRRLARRFSIIGPKHNFNVILNGESVSISDRGYHNLVQYLWTYGEKGGEFADAATHLDESTQRSSDIADTDPPLEN